MEKKEVGARYFKAIVGEKVYLSPVNPEDAEKYVEFLSDLKVGVPLGAFRGPQSILRERKFLEKMAEKGQHFAIIDNKTNELLGNCSLESFGGPHRTADLGIFLKKEAHGKGYGKEAIQLLLSHGFSFLNLNCIALTVFEFNERAISVYKKIGFKEMGKRRAHLYLHGKYYDTLLFDILESEFKYPPFYKQIDKLLKGLKGHKKEK